MKTSLLILLITPSLVLAQGSLTPPGPPAPTMKTLTQVEPRTDLATVAGDATAMHVITQSGSYYLSSNLDVTTSSGIKIEASGVTLDLNGFTILRSSTDPATGTAISFTVPGLDNVWIKNGHINSGVTYDSGASADQFTGPGFAYGVREFASPDPTNIRISHLHVTGCDLDGIYLGTNRSNTVEFCSIRIAGSIGIAAGEVHHSTALFCGAAGITAQGNVSHSRGECVGTSGDGIFANGNVFNSVGRSSGDDGIQSADNVSNSHGKSTGTGSNANGIEASGNVSNSVGESSGDDGIDTFSTISYSRGVSTGPGPTAYGLECTIAIGCTSTGGEDIGNKYLMP